MPKKQRTTKKQVRNGAILRKVPNLWSQFDDDDEPTLRRKQLGFMNKYLARPFQKIHIFPSKLVSHSEFT